MDISHSYKPASPASTLTMISSWLSAVKKWRSVGNRGPLSLLQAREGLGLPLLWHSNTAVSPTFTTLSSMGLTNLGTSSTLRVMLVVIAPARLDAVHVYTPISAARTSWIS